MAIGSRYNGGGALQGVVIEGNVAADGTITAPGGSSSTSPSFVKASSSVPLGFQQIVGAATSTALTVPTGATFAIIQPVAQAIAWRDDGVAPTATVGMLVPADGELLYDGTLATFRLIQVAATATINVSYYR